MGSGLGGLPIIYARYGRSKFRMKKRFKVAKHKPRSESGKPFVVSTSSRGLDSS